MTNLSGSCSCGAVGYWLMSEPMFVHCCHCRDCQRQTGSALVLNALIEAEQVQILQGDTRSFPQPTDSGRPHVIHRCPDCGTALWSNYGGREEVRFVRVGTLEVPSALPPDVHIYTRSKQPWVSIPRGVPRGPAVLHLLYNPLLPRPGRTSLPGRREVSGPGLS